MTPLRARVSTDAELDALDAVCERLTGFDASFSFERVDGLLCAIAAGPRELPAAEWLGPLFGDTFERAFGDPQSQAEAVATLESRLAVLRDQLDPEALFEQPDYLRLEPLMAQWTEEEREKLVAEGALSADERHLLQDGVEWAAGFLQAVDALPAFWAQPPEEEAAEAFARSFRQVEALLLAPDSDELKAHIAEFYPAEGEDAKPGKAAKVEGPPSREDLLGEACMSIQDLRMYWVDFAPKTPTRRVEAEPGRNDPCHCGSGKKYKKCHGANA